MYSSYNRRPYMSKESENKIEKNIPESNENTDITTPKSSSEDNIKLLLESFNEIKKSVKKLEESIIDIAARLARWENNFDIESNCRNIQNQYDSKNISNQHYYQNNDDTNTKTSYQNDKNSDSPIMPGTGFSNITAEYLRNLYKNK